MCVYMHARTHTHTHTFHTINILIRRTIVKYDYGEQFWLEIHQYPCKQL
jgi:hypothetical protein